MAAVRRVLLLAGLVALLGTGGCSSMWHELQPHRLHQLNRGPGMATGPETYSSLVVGSPAA